jgi:hypothetical protein
MLFNEKYLVWCSFFILGIQIGDLIVALEGNPIASYEDFASVIKFVSRPVRIQFFRQEGANSSTNITPSQSSDASSATGSGNGSMSSIFRSFSGTAAKPSKAPEPALTEEERRQRREVLSAAAQDRSKAWDKKITQKKQQSVNNTSGIIVDPDSATDVAATHHEETQRAIQKTKELEKKIEKDMGYNPFKPHMSFTSGAAGNGTCSSGSATGATTETGNIGSSSGSGKGGSSNGLPVLSEADCEDLMPEVDDAFAMLLSLGI